VARSAGVGEDAPVSLELAAWTKDEIDAICHSDGKTGCERLF
jgi:hypothetical protein